MAFPAQIIRHEVGRHEVGGASPGAADGAPSASERFMLDSVQRLVRSAEPRQFIVLHFSRMPPPGPRAHHRRVARALLQDVAHGFEGQVFVMRNGDLALMCRPGREGESPEQGRRGDGPGGLPATLALLMRSWRGPVYERTMR